MLIGTVATLYYGDVQNVPNQNLQACIFALQIFAVIVASIWSNATIQRLAAVVYFAGSVLLFVLGDPMLAST